MVDGKNQSLFKDKPIKVLLAKPGIDGHDRGILVLARAFRDAGMEVLYAGLLPTPEEVIDTAVNEDVDVVALSLLNGAHMTVFKKVAEIMKSRNIDDIALVGGGTIPDEDKPELEKMGITGNYGPGTPLSVIIDHVTKRASEARERKIR
ncbi:cobalamin B12-binding domain-containing protein [Cuniculiplasma divulgatum]|jgi:methylmalonyl-CoA mutase C-terminal domain/subunit|uniref:Isobutyryl-CoA mutase subunit B n=1 Tax=Cuniculiplasma divulgatum TaxID=1673428 RepID=A0A1N5UFU0_9ARCH|nr:cobalamin B12-binding domain-containing protein [Cuniculiplasma divulgatum]MCI2411857.1 cobalamin B12-binding domain-containing protein [Cuniculiplasma sp.]OWP54480.1 MAG: methylmalonyl-CoA mutase [Cuniculiplasma sp. C_DKE]WMT49045.1 MAG: cobalamin B12-binding domain-containing protein [Thermoplasmatales archaeon]SIM59078.1 isobutyryl-CoA mutase subunit B [Cuniculiplasma divulgatum]SJK84763.1 isobutyryl-CoA mutase subunit B [Cuniculiplasma divulgatum]